jgi:mRNA-degrading endonuclease RelE of RelBE toxin-antitoxin system
MARIRIEFTDAFEDELSRLDDKYPGAEAEVATLVDQLANGELPGDLIPNVGSTVYKVRLANRAARRGKRGGFRVIYYVRVREHIYMLTIYSKTKREDVTAAEIRALIKRIGL